METEHDQQTVSDYISKIESSSIELDNVIKEINNELSQRDSFDL